jgi:hypothetical protein
VSAPACALWADVGRVVRPHGDARLQAHLHACADCRAGLAQVGRAAATLKAADYRAPRGQAWEQARTRLMAAVTPAMVARPAPRRLWVKILVTLAASLSGATVVAAVGTYVRDSLSAQPEETAHVSRERRRASRHRGALATRELPDDAVAAELPPAEAPPAIAPPSEAHAVAPPSPRAGSPARVVPGSTRAARGPSPRASVPGAVAPPVPALAVAAQPLPAPAAPLAPPPLSLPSPARETPTPASPAELAFNLGWQALRAGDHRGAAALMNRAIAAGPAGVLDEDARYWRAVALGRAGASFEARAAMEEFRRLYPSSRRAGEVAAMLGWLLVEAGERGRAGPLFRAALADPSPAVRDSARAGLAALGP